MNLKNRIKIALSLIKHAGIIYRKRGRFFIAFEYYEEKIKEIFRWLDQSKEDHNFTYELTPLNKQYLASLLSTITGVDCEAILGYIRELEEDKMLINHLLENSKDIPNADNQVHFGRRSGWYVMARIIKPMLIIETGVEKGMGACVLTTALMRNSKEGFPGKYIGTDINPKAGLLFKPPYTDFGKIMYGDSIASLKTIHEKADLFINDSDHSEEYEAAEYEIIKDKLSDKAVILGDNAHVTNKLLEFSLKNNRRFVFFQEQPEHHWYPGAGIGISMKK